MGRHDLGVVQRHVCLGHLTCSGQGVRTQFRGMVGAGLSGDLGVELHLLRASPGECVHLGEGGADQVAGALDLLGELIDGAKQEGVQSVESFDLVLQTGDQAQRRLVPVDQGLDVVDGEAGLGDVLHAGDREVDEVVDGVDADFERLAAECPDFLPAADAVAHAHPAVDECQLGS